MFLTIPDPVVDQSDGKPSHSSSYRFESYLLVSGDLRRDSLSRKKRAKRNVLHLHIIVHPFYSDTYLHLFFYNDYRDIAVFDKYNRYIEDTYLNGRYDLAILVNVTFELLFLGATAVYIITGNDIKINERVSSNRLS